MATTYLVGNDGAVALPAAHGMNVKVWAATLTRVSSDITGFGDTGKRRRLGIVDVTGSLSGTPFYGGTGNSAGMDVAQAGGTLVLSLSGQTATTTSATSAAFISMSCVFDQFALNVDKNGESSLTMNYQLSGGAAPTIVWSTS